MHIDNRTTPFTVLYTLDRDNVTIHNLRMPYHDQPYPTYRFTEQELNVRFSYDEDHTRAHDKQAWRDYRAEDLAIMGPDWIPFTHRPRITLPPLYEARLTYRLCHLDNMTDNQAIAAYAT